MSPSGQDPFRLLVENANCFVAIVRQDLAVAYFNRFGQQLTGYGEDEVVGHDFLERFIPAAEQEEVGTAIRAAQQLRRSTSGSEVAICCRDGRQRWLEWNTQWLEDFEGQEGWLVLGHDVTDRVQAIEDLTRQQAELRAVLDTAVDGIITINERGEIQSVNKAAETTFGYASQELQGRNISMLMPAPYRDEHDQYLDNYLRTGVRRIIGIGREVEALRKDGTTFPCDIAVSEIPLPGQRLFTGFVRDVSDRKRAQDALVERETLLQTIFDTEPECVKLLAADNRLLRINAAGMRILEVESRKDVIGSSVLPLIAPEYRDEFSKLTRAVFDGETRTLQFDCLSRKGTRRRLETHAVPLRNSKGTITALLAITRDITEQKRAEERALQAERLAAIGQTVAGLAHESRNAFQRSQACLELLAMDLEDQPEQMELVERIQRALNHLHKLYEEVRDYAAPINIDRQPCDLAHTWRDAWSHLELSRRGKAVTLRELPPHPELLCNVDWFAMGQVFRNILENAVSACDSEGEINIRCRETRLDDADALEISVQDSGAGIAPEHRARVFDAFFTTKSKGTGLGMAIAKRLVEAHGGRLELADQPGGAKFVLTVPRGLDAGSP